MSIKKGASMKKRSILSLKVFLLLLSVILFSVTSCTVVDTEPPVGGTVISSEIEIIILNGDELPDNYFVYELYNDKGKTTHTTTETKHTFKTDQNTSIIIRISAMKDQKLTAKFTDSFTFSENSRIEVALLILTNETISTDQKPVKTAAAFRSISSKVLEGYKDEEELRTDINNVVRVYVNNFIKNKAYYYHCILPIDDVIMDGDANVGVGFPEAGEANKADYSTNNQVDNVDEADSVKSDGKYTYLIKDNKLFSLSLSGDIVDTNSPVSGNLTLKKLLIHDNKLIAIASSGYNYWIESYDNSYKTAIVVLNISQDGKLSIDSERLVSGSFITGRSIDNDIHIITNNHIDFWSILMSELNRYSDKFYNLTDEEYEIIAYELAEANMEKWAKSVYDGLFGNQTAQNSDFYRNIVKISRMLKSENNEDIEDDEISFYNNTDVTGLVNIYSFNISSTDNIYRAGYFVSNTQNPVVYSTSDKMIIASNGWIQGNNRWNWDEATFLVSFNLSQSKAKPASFGSVDGYLLNQFSIDFFDNNLRVATTVNNRWSILDDSSWTISNQSHSAITVLDINNKEMSVTGKLSGLGKGERIYSARFTGKKGFVVTFRETDPFYTLDLSDPYNPKMIGELKIPGFSSYLHPIDENLIIGVGRDATETGVVKGLKISLFDVSDFSNPLEIDKLIESDGSFSNAQWDHQAFRYISRENALILPVTWYNNDWENNIFEVKTGFNLYKILNNEIKEFGHIAHVSSDYYWNYYNSGISPRSMLFDNNLITMLADTAISGSV